MTLQEAKDRANTLSDLIDAFNEECSNSEELDYGITRHTSRASTHMLYAIYSIEDKEKEEKENE